MFARKPSDIRPSVQEDQLKWLGHVAGSDYATYKGVEYQVTPDEVNPQHFTRQPGELMVARRVKERIDGTLVERDHLRRAIPVPAGSFERLRAKEAAAKAQAVRKVTPRPLDALAVHPLLRRRQAELLRIAPEADPLVSDMSEKVRGIVLPAKPQRRGPGGIVEALAEKGIELRLTPDKGAIVPIATDGRALDTTRALIEQAAPLLLAHLRGEPLRCQLKHSEKQPPVAETLAVGGAALCAAHASGELASPWA